MHIYIYIYIYVCMYIYIYIERHTYVCILYACGERETESMLLQKLPLKMYLRDNR